MCRRTKKAAAGGGADCGFEGARCDDAAGETWWRSTLKSRWRSWWRHRKTHLAKIPVYDGQIDNDAGAGVRRRRFCLEAGDGHGGGAGSGIQGVWISAEGGGDSAGAVCAGVADAGSAAGAFSSDADHAGWRWWWMSLAEWWVWWRRGGCRGADGGEIFRNCAIRRRHRCSRCGSG